MAKTDKTSGHRGEDNANEGQNIPKKSRNVHVHKPAGPSPLPVLTPEDISVNKDVLYQ